MNKRIQELMIKAIYDVDRIYDPIDNPLNDEVSKMYIPDCFAEKFAELIVRECAKELREAEQEADRAYKAKEVKERNTFDGYDFADMLEERFGVEE